MEKIVVLRNISKIKRLIWAKGEAIEVKPDGVFECFEREAKSLTKAYAHAYAYEASGEYNVKTGDIKIHKEVEAKKEDKAETKKEPKSAKPKGGNWGKVK